jgi:polysaccharide export outer membrane protein
MFCKSCLFLALTSAIALAQQSPPQNGDPTRKYVPLTVEDLLKAKASAALPQQSSANELNDRLRALTVAANSAQDYLLGPGDIISVSVYEVPGLSNAELTLDADGSVLLPFLNEVNLLGLTAREARVKIAALYEVSHLNNPQVAVSVKSYKSQLVYVFGAVAKPGSYSLSGATRVMDILSMVGGITDRAITKAVIRRPTGYQGTDKKVVDTPPGRVVTDSSGRTESSALPPVSYQTIEIDLNQLLLEGSMDLNVPVLGGDIITVPEHPQQFVFVLGDVTRGGAFEIRKNEQLTLQRALALSGGFLPTAKPSKTLIIRPKGELGQSEQIPINAADIFKGKEKDVLLQPNDMILVPGSASKTLGRSALSNVVGSIAGMVGSLLWYGIIYR